MSDINPTQQAPDMPNADDDARPLTGEPVAPMRLRPEPPRVTRLSRKALAVIGGVASVGLGGAQAGSSGEQGDLARALRQGASDGISQTGRQVVGRQLDIAPTLTIRPGFPVRVIVTRDLVLEPYRS